MDAAKCKRVVLGPLPSRRATPIPRKATSTSPLSVSDWSHGPQVSATTKRTLRMITGDIKNQIDRIWDSFWSGGISNPLEVIEQITYLLFIRRLDDLHTLEENKANRLKKPMERRIFP